VSRVSSDKRRVGEGKRLIFLQRGREGEGSKAWLLLGVLALMVQKLRFRMQTRKSREGSARDGESRRGQTRRNGPSRGRLARRRQG